MNYKIKDINLAPDGDKKIDWAKSHMKVLWGLVDEYKSAQPLQNERVVIALHIEAKTANLALAFKSLGAEVIIVASNPLSTQDDVVASLAKRGVYPYAWYQETEEEYISLQKEALQKEPSLIVDDGGDLTTLIHKEFIDLSCKIKGGAEETTTGVLRIKAMAKKGILNFPVIGVNEAYSKHLFDNRYGTGQSAIDGIMRTTNLLIAGKRVVVCGFGWVGKGVAQRIRGLSGKVIVTEVDPVKALEAYMEGYEVMSMDEASKIGDIFITNTGNKNIIRKEHFLKMKNGAILANTGHFNVEIDVKTLKEIAKETKNVRKNVEEFVLENNKSLYLLGEGRLVNLACSDGHPVEIMDLSFAAQLEAVLYIKNNYKSLKKELIKLPLEIDYRISETFLKTQNITIDKLLKEQIEYLEET